MNQPSGRAWAIVNASSGWDSKRDVSSLIRQTFQDRGKDCTVTSVQAGADIGAAVRRAVREGADRVIAAGGDGTLRGVASALAGAGVPLAVIPAGTLNHFARDMGIPLDLDQAAVVAAEGTEVCVDVADVNGHVFINNSVLGLYPFYRIQREAREAAGRGGIRAILGALLQTLRRYPRLTVRLELEGSERIRQTPFLMIANNEHAMEGFKPWQRDSITEGQLWIYLLRDRSRLALLRLLGRIAFGGKLAEREFEVLRAGEVTIETRGRRIRVSLDGELLSLSTPLRYRSRPGSLRVLAPPDSKRVSESACPAEQAR